MSQFYPNARERSQFWCGGHSLVVTVLSLLVMAGAERENDGSAADLSQCCSPAVASTAAAAGDAAHVRRRRSQSVASAQPSVETVVVKAKRAATTLWTLLHAKVRIRIACGSEMALCADVVLYQR